MDSRSVPFEMIATVAAVGLLLTSCSANEETAASSSGNAVKAVERGDLTQGGTLKWPVLDITENLNFAHIEGGNVDTKRIMSSMMPLTMKSDGAGHVEPNPDYLTAAVIGRVSGKQVITYRINPKARWSDGKRLSYRDFAATWKARNGKNPAYKPSSTTGYESVSSVAKGKNDQEVVVTFARPFGDWKSLFSLLYPASVIGTPQGFNTGYQGKVPVTAAPFTFAGADRTAKTLTVVRDNNWWGRKAILDKIVFRRLDQAAAVGAFANREVDYFVIGADASAHKQLQGVAHAQIHRNTSPNFRHITLNGKSKLLSDVRVRRSVAQAINRKAIAESDLRGLGWRSEPLGNHFLFPQQKNYQDNAGEIGTYNVKNANARLDAAGWKRTGGIRTKAGTTLRLTFLIPAGDHAAANESKLLRLMLGAIGVQLNVKQVPPEQQFSRYILPGDYDMTAFNWFGTPFPASSNKAIYVNPKGSRIQLNFARVGTAAIDNALNDAAAALEPMQAVKALNTADHLIWQQAAVIPLYQSPEIVACDKSLANLGAQGFATVDYEDIGFSTTR